MAGTTDQSFEDALLAAPVGVALLAGLEAAQRDDLVRVEAPIESDPRAVQRAVDALEAMSFGRLVATAVEVGQSFASPWRSGEAPMQLAHAYHGAHDRRPIAEAVAARFGAELHSTTTVGPQEWWLSYDPNNDWFRRPLFAPLAEVYGNGEFTSRGLWTVTDPPAEAHLDLLGAWEMDDRSISRWALPVAPGARVWQVHRPADWVGLVTAYPKVATEAHSGWELPGPNQHRAEINTLLDAPGQHAARTTIGRHVLPDWRAVATDYDGVHLSWAGFLTTEGFVSDLHGGGVTMLRYWFSERTLWLADVFGEPVPLPEPTLPGWVEQITAIDPRKDPGRRAQDREIIRAQIGR